MDYDDYNYTSSGSNIPIAVSVIALIMLVFVLPSIFGQLQCNEVGDVTGRNTTYKLMSGCYIEVNGKMVPSDSWRGEQDK